jgi:integrase
MSRVREVGAEAVEEPRSGVPSGEPEASREVRWSARRKEQVVLRLLRGESLDLLHVAMRKDVARVAPRQAQLALGTVKQVLRDAMKRGQRVDPALLDVKAPGHEEREPVFLSAAEVEHLASWCSEPRLVVFAALSGLRLGEVLALRDTDVNLDEGFVLVRRSARKGVEGRTKTRKRRRVYLCARAVKALREQLLARRPNSHGLVFPSPRSDSIWNSDNFRADVFAKAVKRAAASVEPARREDFGRVDFHDLRHTFASLMIAAGANPLQLGEALGHGAAILHENARTTPISRDFAWWPGGASTSLHVAFGGSRPIQAPWNRRP